MPWNFPTWQVFRFLVPCLMAGNVGLLSHAEISTGTALRIEALLQEAEFPENVFRTLLTDNQGSAQVIANPSVSAVTLTGSERAGSAVASQAGKVLKKVVMELGGSDPYLVLNDANLELAAEQIVLSRMNVSGQVCIAAKRIIATREVMPKLQALILEKLKRYQMSDPSLPECNFGPLARADLRQTLHQQVTDSIDKGAKLLTGGVIPDGEGFYYPPTALSNVSKGMAAFDQELFGPVVVFIEVRDEREGVKVANDTPYGLGAAVFTKDLERGEQLAKEELEAGAVFVNGLVSSDPRLPFGGIKLSGFGRELSEEGIKEFVNTKTVVVK
jgi:succinate-semialdehyde dehydrogenase/glutarate-semialdehyde dehydrogenase